MARVVVVGGGFGGLSAAARLAKLRHHVTLVESTDVLGGRLRHHAVGNHAWPLCEETVTLPGVLRDLFRKSGRPIDQVLDLHPTDGRRHVFADKSVLDLPFERAAQHDALTEFIGQDRWSPWLDEMADQWDILRREHLESLNPPGRAVRSALYGGKRLKKWPYKKLKDDRLEAVVLDPAILEGDHPTFVPAFVALHHYVERTFGRWRIDGGTPALADALSARLDERGVDVRTGTHVHELQMTGRDPITRVTGVVTDDGTIPADIVVWTGSRTPKPLADPAGLPIIPASRTLIRVDGSTAPQLPSDVFAHSNPPVHMWPAGPNAWTIAHHNAEDPLLALARVGIDLRPHVTERHDLGPVELVGLGAWGWQWLGWRTAITRPCRGFDDSLFFAGANAHPGPTIELIGSATAAIAERVGSP